MRLALLLGLAVAATAHGSSDGSNDGSSFGIGDGVDGLDFDGSNSVVRPPLTAVGDKLKWLDCAYIPSPLRASAFECATIRVPVCHADAPCGTQQTHALEIKRRDVSPAAAVILTDNDNANSVAAMMECIGQQAGGATINVYAHETRLANPPMGALEDFDSVDATPCGSLVWTYGARVSVDGSTLDAVTKCQGWLLDAFGTTSTSMYSLDAATGDLALALRVLQANELKGNPNVYLMGAGKASRIVQKFMQLQTNITIAGYILDSPLAMQFGVTQDQIVGESTTRFIEGCASDALCHAKFASLGMSMKDILASAYSVLDTSPMKAASTCLVMLKEAAFDDSRDLKPSHGVRRFLAELRREPSTYKLVAPLLYRVQRCAGHDVSALHVLFTRIKNSKSSSTLFQGAAKASMTAFMDRVVAYSELWPTIPSPPSQEQLVESFTATLVNDGAMLSQLASVCAFTAGVSDICKAVSKKTAQVNATHVLTYTTATKPANSTALPATDVLLLASRLSTTGSAAVAEQLYHGFDDRGRTCVLVETDTLASTELGDAATSDMLQLVGRFLTRQASDRNGKWHLRDFSAPTASASTLSTAPVKVDFTLSEDQVRTWFSYRKNSQADPYEETKSSPSSSLYGSGEGTSWTPYIVFGVAVVLVLVVVLAVSLRAGRRTPGARDDAVHGPPQHTQPTLQEPSAVWVAEPVNEYAWGYTPAQVAVPTSEQERARWQGR